eukprot:524549-Pelagomonas_calceolata.AAC.2
MQETAVHTSCKKSLGQATPQHSYQLRSRSQGSSCRGGADTKGTAAMEGQQPLGVEDSPHSRFLRRGQGRQPTLASFNCHEGCPSLHDSLC